MPEPKITVSTSEAAGEYHATMTELRFEDANLPTTWCAKAAPYDGAEGAAYERQAEAIVNGGKR